MSLIFCIVCSFIMQYVFTVYCVCICAVFFSTITKSVITQELRGESAQKRNKNRKLHYFEHHLHYKQALKLRDK